MKLTELIGELVCAFTERGPIFGTLISVGNDGYAQLLTRTGETVNVPWDTLV